jgi:hypothetical protein
MPTALKCLQALPIPLSHEPASDAEPGGAANVPDPAGDRAGKTSAMKATELTKVGDTPHIGRRGDHRDGPNSSSARCRCSSPTKERRWVEETFPHSPDRPSGAAH